MLNAFSNLEKCADAMFLEVEVTEMLQDNLFKSNPAMFTVEDKLLSLAATKAVDGIFYCVVLKIRHEQQEYYFARYFESGAFIGFFESVGHLKLKEKLEVEVLLPFCVYTVKDIVIEEGRSDDLFTNVKSTGRFLKLFLETFFEEVLAPLFMNYLRKCLLYKNIYWFSSQLWIFFMRCLLNLIF